jgi:phospholipid/cholesterol/gamma-HCH transport system substrate-binding protein
MIKHAPSPARVAAMVGFAFSCFLILLLLWLEFGGSLPLRPQGYQVKVGFPEGIGLTKDIDVRTAGISIGTVSDVDVDRRAGRAVATLVLDSRYAPLSRDARAIIRRKTLLGEAFVEITTGRADGPKVRDGGRLPDAQVGETVELDEIFRSYDPQTRRAFRMWQQELAKGVYRRGEDLNNAVSRLPDFTGEGADLFEVLHEQESAVRGLFRDTGEVYSALTQDENQLANLIRNSHGLFRQTAAERVSLREAFAIFPTFLAESRVTLGRLERFARDTRPLVRDLRPVARELRPTVRAVRAFAPDLKLFFRRFGVQIRASRRGLPALREILDETRPLFGSLGPFLSEFNPIFQWIELHQHLVADFLSYSPSGLADTIPSAPEGEMGHYLRQLGVSGFESIGIHRNRASTNRGNAYLPPIYTGRRTSDMLIQPNWDCIPAGGERRPEPAPVGAQPGCWIYPPLQFQGRTQGRFTHVERADYSR